jgi:hypothetical protein
MNSCPVCVWEKACEETRVYPEIAEEFILTKSSWQTLATLKWLVGVKTVFEE